MSNSQSYSIPQMLKLPDDFGINRKLAAKFLGRAPRTLEDWRTDGKGPQFYLDGGRRAMYRMGDLREFREKHPVLPATGNHRRFKGKRWIPEDLVKHRFFKTVAEVREAAGDRRLPRPEPGEWWYEEAIRKWFADWSPEKRWFMRTIRK